MVWGCLSARGTGQLVCIKERMNGAVMWSERQDKKTPPISESTENETQLDLQDNDPKHITRERKERLRQKHFMVLEWPRQSNTFFKNQCDFLDCFDIPSFRVEVQL